VGGLNKLVKVNTQSGFLALRKVSSIHLSFDGSFSQVEYKGCPGVEAEINNYCDEGVK